MTTPEHPDPFAKEHAPLTIDQAYAAAFQLLQNWYKLGPSDELRDLISAMYLSSPRRSSDPALWYDWVEAVRATRDGEVDIFLKR